MCADKFHFAITEKIQKSDNLITAYSRRIQCSLLMITFEIDNPNREIFRSPEGRIPSLKTLRGRGHPRVLMQVATRGRTATQRGRSHVRYGVSTLFQAHQPHERLENFTTRRKSRLGSRRVLSSPVLTSTMVPELCLSLSVFQGPLRATQKEGTLEQGGACTEESTEQGRSDEICLEDEGRKRRRDDTRRARRGGDFS